MRPGQVGEDAAPGLPLTERQPQLLHRAGLLREAEERDLLVIEVAQADLVTGPQGPPGGLLIGPDAVLELGAEVDPQVLVRPCRGRDLRAASERPVVGQRIHEVELDVPVPAGVDDRGVGQLDLAAPPASVRLELELPGRRGPTRLEAPAEPAVAPRGLAAQVGPDVDLEDPEVPGIVDLVRRDEAVEQALVHRLGAHHLDRRRRAGQQGVACDPHPEHAPEAPHRFVTDVGAERAEGEPVVDVLQTVLADEVDHVGPPAARGALPGHDHVELCILPLAHPVDPIDLGAKLALIAGAPARALQEDAQGTVRATHRLRILRRRRDGPRAEHRTREGEADEPSAGAGHAPARGIEDRPTAQDVSGSGSNTSVPTALLRAPAGSGSGANGPGR